MNASNQGHPLDPLNAEEIARAAVACKKYAVDEALGFLRFNSVMLQELRKADLLRFETEKTQLPRQAYCVLILPKSNRSAEAVVTLKAGNDTVDWWKWLEGVQPLTTPEDNFFAEDIVKADPYVRSLLQDRYGIEDVSSIVVDTWAVHCGPENLNNRRLMQGFLYQKLSANDNEYAHPLDLVPLVDLNEEAVIHVDMYDVVPRVPMECNNYHRDLQTSGWRQDIKPLHVTMPQGPSFSVDGHYVRWQKWHLRLGFNCREGLVLHNVGYEDDGRVRPVFHRMSLVEMAVPYGDPGYPYVRKCAFDVGDYGFGFCANSLELGCDCLGAIKYFDVCYNNSKGDPVVVKKAICMHEEDAGILWKHFDCRTNHVEVRRSRRLVVSMIATFMNYEYCLYWYFYQDGTIQFEIKLSGILSTSVFYPGRSIKPEYGTLVGENVVGSNHQHFFCMRLDPAIDDDNGGKDLMVVECNAEPLPDGPGNPFGNGFVMRDTPLTTVHEAQRLVCAEVARHWKILNPNVVNPVSKVPVAYKLYPAPGCNMMAKPYSQVATRGVFASKNLWVTPHSDDQRWPAGDHVVQSTRCYGIAEWTKEDRSLEGADPVVWYTFGVTHSPRPEDYPVMPAEALSFMLKPYSFFLRNPGVDVPAVRNPASREVLVTDDKLMTASRGGGGGPEPACCRL